MIIHIPGKGAFKKERTGIEEYIYHLLNRWSKEEFKNLEFIIYLQKEPTEDNKLYRRLKENDSFTIKVIRLPYLWTQLRLSWEMFKFRVCSVFRVSCSLVLFVPAHITPLVCPKNIVVTVHGLEFEHYPAYYPLWHRLYLKWMTKLSCRRATKIIAVSESTKRDLIRFYGCDANKITVIYHGANTPMSTDERRPSASSPINTDNDDDKDDDNADNLRSPQINISESSVSEQSERSSVRYQCVNKKKEKRNKKQEITSYQLPATSYNYILYLGRIELKKNILNIIRAFSLLKQHAEPCGTERRGTSRNSSVKFSGLSSVKFRDIKLVLAGAPGYGYHQIRITIHESRIKNDIIMTGYVGEKEKWELLRGAKVFLFPTFYEGFGMPVLEAQAVGTPVVTSDVGAAREITIDDDDDDDNDKDDDNADNLRLPQNNVAAGLAPAQRGDHKGRSYKENDFKSLVRGRFLRSSAMLVDPSKPKEIAQAVIKIMTDESLRKNLIKAGKNNAKRFSWDIAAKRTLLLLQKVITKSEV